MHKLLSRQLKRLGLDESKPPTLEEWSLLLERIDKTYTQIDQDRYLLERSLALSSEEMRKLYENLQRASQTELAIERNKLKESLEKIQKLSLVASKARYGVTIADASGRAEWVNNGFTQLSGYEEAEILGKTPGQLMQGPETDPKTVKQIAQRLARRERVSTEMLNYAKDGRKYWVSLEIEPVFDDQGQLTNFIATQTDITERKAYEAELHRAKEEAESANRAKSQFLANMSHEIRTPLNAVLGFTELLLREDDGTNADRIDSLKTIDESGKHLLELINDVLDLSKIEAQKLEVERIECSPHQIIAQVVSALRVRAQEQRIALEYHWASRIPQSIQSDPYRLKQLLLNLVGNAIKFTKKGHVSITASVEPRDDNGVLKIAVNDTGVGIPPDKLDAIFEPFTQADNSVTRQFGGTGLGLSICRKIVGALGGEISVDSAPGVGSTFIVTAATGDLRNVPFAEVSANQRTADVYRHDASEADLTGVRVLLAEDGVANRKLIRLLLQRRGALVAIAENGQIALQLAAEKNFDVVLMDIQMPVMDGYTASTGLRAMGYAGPIIALTAHAMKGDQEKCQQAGCTDYLAKPISGDTLFAKLAEVVARHGRQSPPTSGPPLASVGGVVPSAMTPQLPQS